MNKLMIISADCHAGLPPKEYKAYLDLEYHQACEDWADSGYTSYDLRKEATRRLQRSFMRLAQRYPDVVDRPGITTPAEFAEMLREHLPELSQEEADDWAETSAHNASVYVRDLDSRQKELEGDGVCAEVIFPQGGIPFGADAALVRVQDTFGLEAPEFPPEMTFAGTRAYHRWLSEFVGQSPDRMVGVATIPTLADVDRAVAELEWAAQHGLKGVVIRAAELGLPPLYDERYERFWAACADLAMPVHSHVGTGQLTTYGTGPYSGSALGFEVMFWVHRPLWLMMFGGVLRRFPDLQLIFTEQSTHWVPMYLKLMDKRYESAPYFNYLLPERPSQMWKRNCFVGASSISKSEVEEREDIGVETMMFGSDFPHQEATWPHTCAYLNTVLRGCSEEEVRMICGENAARAYGFDVEKLRPVADRIGPDVEDVMSNSGPLAKEAARYPRTQRGDTFGWVL
jgi:predicted TIM-barrel fold metal-dependent hydrolase